MYDSIKSNKEANLIIEFMNEETEINPQSLTILDKTITISKEISRYEILLKDNSLYENKMYPCFLQYGTQKVSFEMKINYGQDNYYFFGRKKNKMSFEFIFADFPNKKIDNNKCYIKYNGKKYFSHDDKSFLQLRCLNLINVDLNLIEFPISFEQKEISPEIFNDTSFLVFISVAEETSKIFGIFLNKPFIEEKEKLTAESVCSLLEPSIKKVKDILNYDEKKSFEEFKDGIHKDKKYTEYINEIRKSKELEKKVIPFFSFYRKDLTDEEIKAFDIYSEFMLTFPSFKSFKRENAQQTNAYMFYRQHYHSHKAIENFMKTIPNTLSKAQKAILKYSACRCLRTLLFEGFAYFQENLFYFCDLNKENTIYKEAIKFNEKIIESLTEKSEIFLYLLQINSGSSINKLTNDLTARISMLKLQQIQNHLRNSLPDYLIRLDCRCNFLGETFNEVKTTIISELNLFGFFLDDENLKGGETDSNYNKRLIASNLLQHERFGHVKFSINFFSFKQDKGYSPLNDYNNDEPLSPRQFYQVKNEKNEKNERFIEVVLNSEQLGKIGESGYAFNIFLTRGDKDNISILRYLGANFTELFKKPELFAAEDLTNLNILIKNSAPGEDVPIYELKKVSEEKYEIKKFEHHNFDIGPTIPKYHS